MDQTTTIIAATLVGGAIAATAFLTMDILKDFTRVALLGSRNTGYGVAFDPARDMPSLAGKVVLVTGGAGDLGKQMVLDLARHGGPARIYIADLPRADGGAGVMGEIREVVPGAELVFLPIDLGSFESVEGAVAEFTGKETRLDICILNAGIMPVKPGKTKDGYEVVFGVNYLGHALLAELLMPLLVRTAEEQKGSDVRLLLTSSEGHSMVSKGGILFDTLRTDGSELQYWHRYGRSKLALIFLARELAARYLTVKTASIHPGRIITGLARRLGEESLFVRVTSLIAPLICVPVSVGVRNHLWAATGDGLVSGRYYEPVGVPDKESTLAKDGALSARLWDWTEAQFKEKGIKVSPR